MWGWRSCIYQKGHSHSLQCVFLGDGSCWWVSQNMTYINITPTDWLKWFYYWKKTSNRRTQWKTAINVISKICVICLCEAADTVNLPFPGSGWCYRTNNNHENPSSLFLDRVPWCSWWAALWTENIKKKKILFEECFFWYICDLVINTHLILF